MAHPKNAISCSTAKIMLRFLPYSGRLPYATRARTGSYEECFASRQDATARFRELRQERRIESAEIIQELPNSRMERTLMEWRDRVPLKWHRKRR